MFFVWYLFVIIESNKNSLPTNLCVPHNNRGERIIEENTDLENEGVNNFSKNDLKDSLLPTIESLRDCLQSQWTIILEIN